MKAGKAARPLGVSAEMIAVSGEIRIGVMVELCQGFWMWYRLSRGKGDAMSCVAYRRVKLLEHAMKITL